MSMPCQSCIPCTSETNLGCRCWCHLPSKNRCTLGFTFYFECTFCSSFGGQSWPGNAKRVYATSSLVCNWCTKKLDFVVQQTFHLMSAEFSILHISTWALTCLCTPFPEVLAVSTLDSSTSLSALSTVSRCEQSWTRHATSLQPRQAFQLWNWKDLKGCCAFLGYGPAHRRIRTNGRCVGIWMKCAMLKCACEFQESKQRGMYSIELRVITKHKNQKKLHYSYYMTICFINYHWKTT